jgi:Zn-dependent protease with chaperone function
MLAVGIDALPNQGVVGFLWLAGAAVVALIGTIRLQSAEGFKPRSVKSGELHRRSFVLAKRMGVRLRRVYVVPSGKSHLTNAFGGLFKTIGVSDDYGKWLKGSQLDFVIGHELAHIQQKHALKKLAGLLGLFSLTVGLGFGLPHLSSAVLTIVPFVVVFVPLITFYSLSRRFEYEADRAAAGLTNDPDAAIQALASLYRHTQKPAEYNRFAEFFSTHPSLSRRVEAIARSHQLTAERLSNLGRHIY